MHTWTQCKMKGLLSIGIPDTLVSDEYVEQLVDTDDNKLSDTDESSDTDIYLLYLLDGKVLSFSSCGNISTHVTSTVWEPSKWQGWKCWRNWKKKARDVMSLCSTCLCLSCGVIEEYYNDFILPWSLKWWNTLSTSHVFCLDGGLLPAPSMHTTHYTMIHATATYYLYVLYDGVLICP